MRSSAIHLCIGEDYLGMPTTDDRASEHGPTRHGVFESLLDIDAAWPSADVYHIELALTEPHAIRRLILGSFNMQDDGCGCETNISAFIVRNSMGTRCIRLTMERSIRERKGVVWAR